MPKLLFISHSNHQCTEFQFPHVANVCYHDIYNYSAPGMKKCLIVASFAFPDNY